MLDFQPQTTHAKTRKYLCSKKIWKYKFLTFAILGIFAYLLFSYNHHHGNFIYDRFIVIYEAGSSHTSAFIFTWETPFKNFREYAPSKSVEPGLSSFASNPSGIEEYLRPLHNYIHSTIPHHVMQPVPIFLKATAGVRLLPEHDREVVMNEAKEVLSKEHGRFYSQKNWVETISGKDEGTYGWIAINYLLGTFNESLNGNNENEAKSSSSSINALARPKKKSPSPTYAVMDLGGGSMQMTFEMPTDEAVLVSLDDVESVTLFNKSHQIFSRSFNAFGRDVLFRTLLSSISRVHVSNILNSAKGNDQSGDNNNNNNNNNNNTLSFPPSVSKFLTEYLAKAKTSKYPFTFKAIVKHEDEHNSETTEEEKKLPLIDYPCAPVGQVWISTAYVDFMSINEGETMIREGRKIPSMAVLRFKGTGDYTKCTEIIRENNLFSFEDDCLMNEEEDDDEDEDKENEDDNDYSDPYKHSYYSHQKYTSIITSPLKRTLPQTEKEAAAAVAEAGAIDRRYGRSRRSLAHCSVKGAIIPRIKESMGIIGISNFGYVHKSLTIMNEYLTKHPFNNSKYSYLDDHSEEELIENYGKYIDDLYDMHLHGERITPVAVPVLPSSYFKPIKSPLPPPTTAQIYNSLGISFCALNTTELKDVLPNDVRHREDYCFSSALISVLLNDGMNVGETHWGSSREWEELYRINSRYGYKFPLNMGKKRRSSKYHSERIGSLPRKNWGGELKLPELSPNKDNNNNNQQFTSLKQDEVKHTLPSLSHLDKEEQQSLLYLLNYINIDDLNPNIFMVTSLYKPNDANWPLGAAIFEANALSGNVNGGVMHGGHNLVGHSRHSSDYSSHSVKESYSSKGKGTKESRESKSSVSDGSKDNNNNNNNNFTYQGFIDDLVLLAYRTDDKDIPKSYFAVFLFIVFSLFSIFLILMVLWAFILIHYKNASLIQSPVLGMSTLVSPPPSRTNSAINTIAPSPVKNESPVFSQAHTPIDIETNNAENKFQEQQKAQQAAISASSLSFADGSSKIKSPSVTKASYFSPSTSLSAFGDLSDDGHIPLKTPSPHLSDVAVMRYGSKTHSPSSGFATSPGVVFMPTTSSSLDK